MNKRHQINLYEEISPVPCFQLKIIGTVCVIIMVLAIIFNGILIVLYFRHKDLRTPLNTLIISLAVVNFIGAFLEFPFIIVSNFYCR